MARYYLDTGVLLAAFKGEGDIGRRALEVLDDPEHCLVVSEAVRLELFPKAVFEKRQEELAFYREVFAVADVVPWRVETLDRAQQLAEQYGIAAMDSIHVANALAAGVDGVITTEQTTKPMFRVQEILVRSLLSETAT